MAGVRASVTWLHQRAGEMGDDKARQILNTAAAHLGATILKREQSNDR